jgi:hypothetical protein
MLPHHLNIYLLKDQVAVTKFGPEPALTANA